LYHRILNVAKPRTLQQKPTAAASPGVASWPRISLIVLLAIVTYASSCSRPFIFDDSAAIVENEGLRDLRQLGRVLNPERELPTAGRPLANLSFALNYALGGLDVRGYHALSLAFHLCCAVLILSIARRTFERPVFPGYVTALAPDLAFATALLWAVHPLNSEVVVYTTQRTESMMAVCWLLTLYASIRALDRPTRGAWLALAVTASACGMLCKESMVTAPVIVVLWDAVFAFGGLAAALRARWRLYAGLACTWIVLVLMLSSNPRPHSAGFTTDVSVWTYLLNQAGMIVHYLSLAVWPRDLVLMYGPPQPLTLAIALPALLVVLALLAATIWALWQRPALGFAGAWVFITLAPTSSLVPIATEVGAERRMYLPLVAITGLVVMAGATLSQRVWPHQVRRSLSLALVLLTASLMAATIRRTQEYASALTMAETVLARRPGGFGQWMVGTEMLRAGMTGEGLSHLREATRLGESQAHYDIGAWQYKNDHLEDAILPLQTFVASHPLDADAVPARAMLADAFARLNQWPQAAEQARLLLTMQKGNVDAVGILAAAAFHQAQFDEAILRYRQYLAFRPDNLQAIVSFGVALANTDRPQEAIAVFERALALDPNNLTAQVDLAIALFERHDFGGAAEHALKAVALSPRSPAAHDILGRVLTVQGHYDEAAAQFRLALQLDPSYPDARDDLERLARAVGGGGRAPSK
jgi:tetratricopeptide (TPR) repeat protein